MSDDNDDDAKQQHQLDASKEASEERAAIEDAQNDTQKRHALEQDLQQDQAPDEPSAAAAPDSSGPDIGGSDSGGAPGMGMSPGSSGGADGGLKGLGADQSNEPAQEQQKGGKKEEPKDVGPEAGVVVSPAGTVQPTTGQEPTQPGMKITGQAKDDGSVDAKVGVSTGMGPEADKMVNEDMGLEKKMNSKEFQGMGEQMGGPGGGMGGPGGGIGGPNPKDMNPMGNATDPNTLQKDPSKALQPTGPVGEVADPERIGSHVNGMGQGLADGLQQAGPVSRDPATRPVQQGINELTKLLKGLQQEAGRTLKNVANGEPGKALGLEPPKPKPGGGKPDEHEKEVKETKRESTADPTATGGGALPGAEEAMKKTVTTIFKLPSTAIPRPGDEKKK